MRELLSERKTDSTPHQAIQANGDNATVNQIQHQEVKQENHIHVNVFGQEQVDHITPPQIYALLMKAKEAADPGLKAVLDTALAVFSDPAKPENLTCYPLAELTNKKTSDSEE